MAKQKYVVLLKQEKAIFSKEILIMTSTTICKKPEHKMHICALKEEGFDKENPAKFKVLIENPQYKCENCGAKAKKAENLCKPIKL